MPPPAPSYEPVRDIFEAMQAEKINGVPLSDVIGGGNPETVLGRHIDLEAQRSVLDVGCGCGRIATGLTQVLDENCDYIGVDILPGLVEFGRKFITPRYPRFKFLVLNEGNFTYDTMRPKGSAVDIAKLGQAAPAGSVGLAISISLFTHLDFAAAADVLKNVSRLLATGGQAFITIFIVDAEARRNIGRGATGFSFGHRTPSGELSAEKLEDPTFAVGYEVEKMDELVNGAGLQREHWIRGYWSQGNFGETFQDALILRKP